MNFQGLRAALLGSPLPTRMMKEERLDKIRALAALSPDALSSITYANQEIYLGLVVAGTAALSLSIPIAIAITALLVILTLSYSQTIQAYPTGGGSYTVASENLGKLPGLTAAAALLIDYVLTAAVSLTAGVAAIASAVPALWPHRIAVAIILLAIITLANLRGLREAGTLISVPVYLFLAAYLAMLAYGFVRAIVEGPAAIASTSAIPVQTGVSVTLFLILHTFSSGCTALTGVEAISNGVSVFKPPEVRNARQTMVIMATLMGVLLLGSIGLTQHFQITTGLEETILSALARHIFGTNIFYYVVQITTLLMLVVAANTSFVDFPRVGSLIAKDRYLPRQLTNLGDRLVFSNGILLLAGCVAALIILFDGDSHALIPLFAVGVFLAFTLSQAGMVVHWRKEHGPGWQLKALINGIGALTTGITFLVVAVSKFAEGAWTIAVLVPALIYIFQRIHNHYVEIGPQLSVNKASLPLAPLPAPRVVIPVASVHVGTLAAIQFARSISKDITALYVELDPEQTEKFRELWRGFCSDIRLEVVPSPYRSLLHPIMTYLEETDLAHADGQSAILVLPEFIPGVWWQNLLHNQTAWMIKLVVLYQRHRHGVGRVIVEVPFYLQD